MTKFILFVIGLAICLSSGCASYKGIVRDFKKTMGVVLVEDIEEADEIAKTLPGYLRISPERIRVTPQLKDTEVVILGVRDSILQDKIRAQVVTYRQARQSGNESLKPIRVRFR